MERNNYLISFLCDFVSANQAELVKRLAAVSGDWNNT